MRQKPKLTNLQQGILTERIVESKFIERSFNTLLPRSPGGTVDLLVEKDNKFIRLQIKSSYYVKDTDCYRSTLLKSEHKKYDLKELDYFVVYNYEYDALYIVPVDLIGEKTSLTMYPHRDKGLSKYASRTKDYNLNDYLNNFDLKSSI